MDGDVERVSIFFLSETSWRQRSEYTREMRTHFEDKKKNGATKVFWNLTD